MLPAAHAQQVLVIVNGEPITALDVEQRGKFLQLSGQKATPRQEIINELINEKLKVREAKRWGLEVTDAEIDSTLGSMAARRASLTESNTRHAVGSEATAPNTSG